MRGCRGREGGRAAAPALPSRAAGRDLGGCLRGSRESRVNVGAGSVTGDGLGPLDPRGDPGPACPERQPRAWEASLSFPAPLTLPLLGPRAPGSRCCLRFVNNNNRGGSSPAAPRSPGRCPPAGVPEGRGSRRGSYLVGAFGYHS